MRTPRRAVRAGLIIAVTSATVVLTNATSLATTPEWNVRVPRTVGGVVNPDLEATVITDGGSVHGSPVGWIGSSLLVNPSDDQYSSLASSQTTGTMAGPMVISLPGSSDGVSQRTSVSVRPGVRYTLTVAVGARDAAGSVWGGARIALLARTRTVAIRSVSTPPKKGSFGDVSVSFTGSTGTAGLPLTIRLGRIPGRGGDHTDYDNVRLVASGRVSASPSTIVVAKPSSHEIFQRSGRNTAVVPVSAAVRRDANVQARLVIRPRQRGRSTGWRTIAGRNNRGYVHGLIPSVAAGWYDLHLRQVDAHGRIVATRTVREVGIGEVFLTAGQSNASNRGNSAWAVSDTRVSAPTQGYGGWQRGNDPQPNATGRGGSPWPVFASWIAKKHNVPVGIVAVAYGGTTVGEWTTTAPEYHRLRSAIAQLKPNGFRAILWHQGEADARDCTPSAVYADRMGRLIAATRKDAGRQVPWITATASNIPGATDQCEADVRAGQTQARASIGGVHAGPDTDGWVRRGLTFDGVHFNRDGLMRHGWAWDQAVQNARILPTH